MDIWHIENEDTTSLLLLRNHNHSFRVVRSGKLRSLFTNPNYLLIEKKYANILNKLPDQVTYKKQNI